MDANIYKFRYFIAKLNIPGKYRFNFRTNSDQLITVQVFTINDSVSLINAFGGIERSDLNPGKRIKINKYLTHDVEGRAGRRMRFGVAVSVNRRTN